MEENTELLEFFKAFSDANRLRMAALLLDEALTIEELAARLKLRMADTPRHLNQLVRLGLVVQEGEHYRLDGKALEALSRQVLSARRPASPPGSSAAGAPEDDHKVVRNYSLPDGRLKEIPLQDKKFQAILRHVIQSIEPGRRYTEKEINLALTRYHADFATLRRGLVDAHMLERENNGAIYWRKES
jgi:hypothetical protein